MQTNPVVEQNKNIMVPRVHSISPVGKEKVYWGEMNLNVTVSKT